MAVIKLEECLFIQQLKLKFRGDNVLWNLIDIKHWLADVFLVA